MYEVGANIKLSDPYGDIPKAVFHSEKSSHKKAHKAIRGHVCTKEMRAALIHEVDAGRLTAFQAGQCVRAFLALQRWCLRQYLLPQRGFGLKDYKAVGNDMGF